jgi:hypothetical protein
MYIKMKKTMYGLLFGFLAFFGVATITPAFAQVPDSDSNG